MSKYPQWLKLLTEPQKPKAINLSILQKIAYLVVVILLCGCAGSQVSLGPPGEVPVDNQLTGKWVQISGVTSDSSISMTVYRFNDYEYLLEYVMNSETLLIRAFTTSIEGILFANVQCIGCDDDDDYIFFRYFLSEEGILKVRPVRTEYYQDPLFKSSQDLFHFIKDHLEDDKIYENEAQFRRAN